MYNHNIKNKSKVLLNKNPISAYWIGFLSADGSFYKTGRIRISLSLKDKDQLIRLAKYIKYSGVYHKSSDYKNHKYITIAFMSRHIKLLMNKYNIKPNKTYNPPKDIPYKNKKLRLAYCIGFVDGDGSIRNYKNRKSFFLTIKSHKNWFKMLKKISKELSNTCSVRINKAFYVELNLSNTTKLKKLKINMLKLHVPYLKRKWNIINLKYKSIQEDTPFKIKEVKRMLLKSKSRKEMSKKINMKVKSLNAFIFRNKLKVY